MTIFDLLFAVLFLTGGISLIVAGIAALRGHRERARRIAQRVGIAAGVYLCALIAVSAIAPQQRFALGDDQCSDDWCIAAQTVRRDTVGAQLRYEVAFRLSSHARRVPQRERFVGVHLLDDRGHRYDPVPDAGEVPFDTLLSPGQAVLAVRRFDVPAGTGHVELAVSRDGAGWFPGCCIIGAPASLLHKRPVVKLEN